MEQAIGTRIGASSWRGTEPASSGGVLDCFVVPPRRDGKGSTNPAPSLRSEAEAIQKRERMKRMDHQNKQTLDCFVVPPRRNTIPAPSLRSEAEAIQKKRTNEEYEQLDCFVVPPRNDGKVGSSLRTEAETIQKTRSSVNRKKETLMERNRGTILVLDCFVVPPRNDGSRSFGESPLNDGAIVYPARALLRSVTGKLIVYSDVCSSAGGSARMLKGETTQGYILLPNPNHGDFELRQLVQNENPVQIEVTDVLGRNIYRKRVVFNNGRTEINLGDLIPGLFCLKILDNSEMSIIKFIVR